MKWTLITLSLLLPFALLGCPAGDDADDTAAAFEGGDFEFSTHAVDDGCLSGAAEAIYMPQGPSVPELWEDPIELPAFEDLPATYTIQLPDPLDSLQITVTAGGAGEFVVEGAHLEDTLFDEDTYPDCTVDSDVDSVLTVQTNDHLTGTITLQNTDYQGDSCPVVEGDPCSVVLDVQADRL